MTRHYNRVLYRAARSILKDDADAEDALQEACLHAFRGIGSFRDEAKLYDIVDVLVAIGEARGVSAARVALAWLSGRPGVASAVIGARTEAQLADNLAAAELKLSHEERARLDQVSAPPLLYPYWHQTGTAGDRLSAADLTLLGPHLSERF